MRIEPKKGSRLYGHSWEAIKRAVSAGVKLPRIYPEDQKQKDYDPKQIKSNDPKQKRDPKYDLIKNMSMEEIQAAFENSKAWKEAQDKNKSRDQLDKEKLQLELTKATKQIKSLQAIIDQQKGLIEQRSSALSNKIINEAVLKAARKYNAIRPELLLRDSELMKRISCDPNTNDIVVKNENGEESIMTIDNLIELHQQETPEFYSTYFDTHNGIGGNIKNNKNDVRSMSPMEKIKYGLEHKENK